MFDQQETEKPGAPDLDLFFMLVAHRDSITSGEVTVEYLEGATCSSPLAGRTWEHWSTGCQRTSSDASAKAICISLRAAANGGLHCSEQHGHGTYSCERWVKSGRNTKLQSLGMG